MAEIKHLSSLAIRVTVTGCSQQIQLTEEIGFNISMFNQHRGNGRNPKGRKLTGENQLQRADSK